MTNVALPDRQDLESSYKFESRQADGGNCLGNEFWLAEVVNVQR
jgi:hypothetical protein